MAETPPAVDLLRTWLDAAGWTQRELASRLDCSTPTVEAWMYGRRRPSFELAAAVAELSSGAVPIGAWAFPARVQGAIARGEKNRTDSIDAAG